MTMTRRIYIGIGVVASLLVVLVLISAIFGSRTDNDPATTPTVSEPTRTQVSVEPSPAAPIDDEPGSDQGSLVAQELKPIETTTDPLKYGYEFAKLWMAPNPTAYSRGEFMDWLKNEHQPNTLDDSRTTGSFKSIDQQVLLPVLWEAAADSGLVQEIEIDIVERSGWLYGTELEPLIIGTSDDLGWVGTTVLDVWGTCLKDENGHQLGHECRAILVLSCTPQRCGIADILTPQIGEIRQASEYRPQGWDY